MQTGCLPVSACIHAGAAYALRSFSPVTYSFTLPITTPDTKYFWRNGYTSRIGTVHRRISAPLIPRPDVYKRQFPQSPAPAVSRRFQTALRRSPEDISGKKRFRKPTSLCPPFFFFSGKPAKISAIKVSRASITYTGCTFHCLSLIHISFPHSSRDQ